MAGSRSPAGRTASGFGISQSAGTRRPRRFRWPKPGDSSSEKRFRALGVRLERGRLVAHSDAQDGRVGNRVTFLSPFDRLVHDRNRAEALWDFFYRLEMYVPKGKRQYGYYVLPILRGDRIIGRIEPVFDRKAKSLRVEGVFAEPGAPASAGPGIASATRRLGRWLGAEKIAYSRRVPSIWRDILRN